MRVSRFEMLKTKSMTAYAALESRLHPSVRVSRFRIQTKAALEEVKPCHGPVVDDATAAAFVTPKKVTAAVKGTAFHNHNLGDQGER